MNVPHENCLRTLDKAGRNDYSYHTTKEEVNAWEKTNVSPAWIL